MIHQQSLRFLGRLSKQVKKDLIFFNSLEFRCNVLHPVSAEDYRGIGRLVGRSVLSLPPQAYAGEEEDESELDAPAYRFEKTHT